jgi:hypothetical protein
MYSHGKPFENALGSGSHALVLPGSSANGFVNAETRRREGIQEKYTIMKDRRAPEMQVSMKWHSSIAHAWQDMLST